MKGFAPKHITLKVDVIGSENILFAGASLHPSAPDILQAEAVKGLRLCMVYCVVVYAVSGCQKSRRKDEDTQQVFAAFSRIAGCGYFFSLIGEGSYRTGHSSVL